MRILHCCLAAFYIDNYGYQENILPKMHKLQGHDVRIIASTETYIDNKKLGYIHPSSYYTVEHIPITRLSYQKWLPHFVMKKLRLYSGLQVQLEAFKPDVLFLHDCQFLSIFTIIDYLKINPSVQVFIDCHTDLINSATNWVSKNILHKIIYRFCAKSIEKYTTWFYGTLPARNEFLKQIYGIDQTKIKLLPFGVDDSSFNWNEEQSVRTDIRMQLNLQESDFVIISGGKIDEKKNIHVLMESFTNLIKNQTISNAKLIIFGEPADEMKESLNAAILNPDILYLEWLPSNEIYKYFFASDLACFPGTHSVLWETAVGVGLPCVFQRWDGIQHVDIGGNCVFVENGKDNAEMQEVLQRIINDKLFYQQMKRTAQIEGPKNFSYTQIAKKALS